MAIDAEHVPWALEQLQQFVAMTQLRVGPRTGLPSGTAQPNDVIISEVPVVEDILDAVTPGWRVSRRESPTSRWAGHREAAQQAITRLQRGSEIHEKLGDGAPTLDAGRLHTWVWDGARSMWQSRHFREAVVAGLKKVNAEAQNKTGRHDLSETALFKRLFSLTSPAPNEPRLRLRDDEGTDTWRSAHIGAMALAEGLFAGIRNVVSHTVAETEADEQVALEQLAAVSVLARWVEDAHVVTAP